MPESDWHDDLADHDGNELIITPGAAIDLNPAPAYSSGSVPDWFAYAYRPGLSRLGDYTAQQVLDGDDVIGAVDCVISHADNGDQGNQSWNATGGGTDPSPAVCLPLGTGVAEATSGTASTSIEVGHNPTIGLVAGSTFAEMRGPSWGLWLGVPKDALSPFGTLFNSAFLTAIDPTTYGYPADATLVWEQAYPTLLRVELGDGDPVATSTAAHANRWLIRDHPIIPQWVDGNTEPWLLGKADDPGSPTADYLAFTYDEGNETTGEWHLYYEGDWNPAWTPNYTGTGADPATADLVVVAWPIEYTLPGDITSSDFESTRPARIAVKYVLQASRFKFVWDAPETTVTPPRRILGRPHPARIFGDNTIQNGRRALGGIL